MQKLSVPTLLIVGERDRAQYHTNLEGWKPPKTLQVHIADTGHHTPLKHPELAERYIRKHLIN